MKISIKDRFDIFLFGTGYKQNFREEKKVNNILILINVTGFIKTLGYKWPQNFTRNQNKQQ